MITEKYTDRQMRPSGSRRGIDVEATLCKCHVPAGKLIFGHFLFKSYESRFCAVYDIFLLMAIVIKH